jgi:hypothetical protein
MTAQKRTPDIEKKKIMKVLTFPLSTNEIAQKGRLAAETRHKILEKNREFDDVKTKYKGQIGALELELSELLHTIKRGDEERNVECTMVLDYERYVVSYVHPVDGEDVTFEERPMTLDERQPELSLARRVERLEKTVEEPAGTA